MAARGQGEEEESHNSSGVESSLGNLHQDLYPGKAGGDDGAGRALSPSATVNARAPLRLEGLQCYSPPADGAAAGTLGRPQQQFAPRRQVEGAPSCGGANSAGQQSC
jgi:hypothetical protein